MKSVRANVTSAGEVRDVGVQRVRANVTSVGEVRDVGVNCVRAKVTSAGGVCDVGGIGIFIVYINMLYACM